MVVSVLFCSFLALLSAPSGFDAARWNIADPNGRAMPYLGQPSLFLDNGIALLRDSSFADGTIEFDLALHGHPSFAGVLFRAAGEEDYELVYVRPQSSRRWDALQYTPVFHGSEGWQLYSGDGYTAAAELAANRWMHVKLLVEGYTARLYVDHAADPQLVITDLKRPWARGQIGFWGRFGGANFANLVVTPAPATSAPVRRDAPLAPGVIGDWELSPVIDGATIAADRLADAVARTRDWLRVAPEASGLVNVARYREPVVARQPNPPAASRDLVFARTTITAGLPTRIRLVFAYSDAVRIFLNGRPLFDGESRFRSRDPGFLGTASLGPDAIYLDLAGGANQLVFAVAETFGGWGFAARVEGLDPDR
jgi:hypothetical protein